MKSVTSVTCDIHVQLLVAGVGPAAVPTTLVYTAADPYAVQAIMDTESGTVEWFFSRELLHDGLRGPAGVGRTRRPRHRRARPARRQHRAQPDGNAILLADATDSRPSWPTPSSSSPSVTSRPPRPRGRCLLLLLTES